MENIKNGFDIAKITKESINDEIDKGATQKAVEMHIDEILWRVSDITEIKLEFADFYVYSNELKLRTYVDNAQGPDITIKLSDSMHFQQFLKYLFKSMTNAF